MNDLAAARAVGRVLLLALRGCDRYGLAVVGNGHTLFEPPEWVVEYDPDAFDGRGSAEADADPGQAIRFASFADAMNFWKQPSTLRPFRHDGRPNRPLTALSVTVETVPEPDA